MPENFITAKRQLELNVDIDAHVGGENSRKSVTDALAQLGWDSADGSYFPLATSLSGRQRRR